jgi:hypothetical protein
MRVCEYKRMLLTIYEYPELNTIQKLLCEISSTGVPSSPEIWHGVSLYTKKNPIGITLVS